jgi:hypothetical protein
MLDHIHGKPPARQLCTHAHTVFLEKEGTTYDPFISKNRKEKFMDKLMGVCRRAAGYH